MGSVIAGLARANAAVFETAQGPHPAQVIAVIKGHIAGFEALCDASAADEFENVALSKTLEIPGAVEVQLIKLFIEAERAADEFAGDGGALAFIGSWPPPRVS